MLTRLLALTLCSTLLACDDGGDDDAGDTAGIDASTAADAAAAADAAPTADATPVPFALTSTAWAEGGVIPVKHSCKGADVSPALSWSGGPAAAGYAVVFTDLTNPLIHSIIWDIAPDVTSLPEGVMKVAEPAVPAGSKQPLAFDNQTRGYRGPCPGSKHTYVMKIIAVDERPLTGVTLNSTRDQLAPILAAHELGSTTLTATFTP